MLRMKFGSCGYWIATLREVHLTPTCSASTLVGSERWERTAELALGILAHHSIPRMNTARFSKCLKLHWKDIGICLAYIVSTIMIPYIWRNSIWVTPWLTVCSSYTFLSFMHGWISAHYCGLEVHVLHAHTLCSACAHSMFRSKTTVCCFNNAQS